MRLSKFLYVYSCFGGEDLKKWTVPTKIFTIARGCEATRQYVLRLLERAIEASRKEVFFLSEIEDSLWQLLSYSDIPLRLIFWEKNRMTDDQIIQFLRNVYYLDGKTIFIDPDDQVRQLLVANFARNATRRFIVCDLPRDSKKKDIYYQNWLVNVEKIDPSPRLVEHVKSRPLIESFNLINTMKYTGEREYNLISADKYGLLWTDQERFLVDVLMYKGRGFFKRESWDELDSGRFMWMVFREIHLLLKVKTIFQGFVDEKAEKMGISKELFWAMKDKAELVTLPDLYKRLRLVTSLLKWRHYPGSVNLLLLYW